MNSSQIKISHALRQIAAVSVMSGGLALLAGCGSSPESHVVSAPPPPAPQLVVTQSQPTQVVVSGTVQTANGGTIIVMQAPPAMQQEVVIAQPSSAHRWIPGYWTWRDNQYQWMAGHWEVPPGSNAVWVTARWEHTSNGAYRFYEGYWN
jgi:hypothetical protein